MIAHYIHHAVDVLPIRSNFIKLLIGSIVIALLISLGMGLILKLLNYHVSFVIPSVLAVIGAAIYAAKYKNRK